MSGVAAMFSRNGQPVAPQTIECMIASVAHRGPDASAAWTEGPIGLGHCLLRTGRHAAPQPFIVDDYGIVLDGRLDNGVEIAAELPDGDALVSADDSTIVLAAYRAWGIGAFRRLLGDFALAIWDGLEHRLVCARDIVGIKPLYYYASPRLFLCGSEMQQLFAAADISTEPNPGMIAEYLCLRVAHGTDTLFRDVARVPPAHALIVTADRIRAERYYDPASAPEIRYRRPEAYAEHYRSTLSEAIRCRLPASGKAAFYLSGGLDSSSLVALAARSVRDGTWSPVEIETYSMVAPGEPGDESVFIRDAARHAGVPSHTWPIVPPDPWGFVDEVRRRRDIPLEPNVVASIPLVRAARAIGCRSIISGLGGDDWLCAYWTHAAELLLHGRLSEFAAVIKADTKGQDARVTARRILLRGVWPLLSPGVQSTIRSLCGMSQFPEYLSESFTASTHLADRLRPHPLYARSPGRTQGELLAWFSSGVMLRGHEVDDRHHAAYGVEARHPFHDRRVIELTLGLPESQRWQGVEPKHVLRRALGPLLPDSVRGRLDKGDYSHAFIKAFDACGGEACFRGLELVDRGWIRGDIVMARYREMMAAHASGDPRYAIWSLRLWMVFGLELWLRHRGWKERV